MHTHTHTALFASLQGMSHWLTFLRNLPSCWPYPKPNTISILSINLLIINTVIGSLNVTVQIQILTPWLIQVHTQTHTYISLPLFCEGPFQSFSVVTLSSAAWRHGASYVNDIFSVNPSINNAFTNKRERERKKERNVSLWRPWLSWTVPSVCDSSFWLMAVSPAILK